MQECLNNLFIERKDDLIKQNKQAALIEMYAKEIESNYMHLESLITYAAKIALKAANPYVNDQARALLDIKFQALVDQFNMDKDKVYQVLSLIPSWVSDIKDGQLVFTETLPRFGITIHDNIFVSQVNSYYGAIDVGEIFQELAHFSELKGSLKSFGVTSIEDALAVKEDLIEILKDNVSNRLEVEMLVDGITEEYNNINKQLLQRISYGV
jgi:hypothetical protein